MLIDLYMVNIIKFLQNKDYYNLAQTLIKKPVIIIFKLQAVGLALLQTSTNVKIKNATEN